MSNAAVICPGCGPAATRKHGRDRQGRQRPYGVNWGAARGWSRRARSRSMTARPGGAGPVPCAAAPGGPAPHRARLPASADGGSRPR